MANEVTTYNVQRTTDLSVEMKTFYHDYIIDIAKPKLVHAQFGQKRPIPQNKGKTVEFRKYSKLPKALTPLTEGVTKAGQSLNVSAVTADIYQYGDYVAVSDVLQLTAIDNNLAEATELLGDQAGRTLDTVVREVINSGTNVMYAGGKTARQLLVGGSDTAANNCYVTVNDIRKAARKLKAYDVETIDGYYIGIVHPDTEFDLMSDPKWEYPHQYVDTENIYDGEIGRIAGVRFVSTSEAKIFHADNLAGTTRNLAINNASGYSGAITSVAFDGGTVAQGALVGRKILINNVTATVTANTASTITFASTNFGSIADNAVIYPGEAGATGRDVYSVLVIGANAYGVTGIDGAAVEHIYKPLGSGEDPLNQRATVGWKAYQGSVILSDENLVRIECASTFESGAN